MVQQIRDVDEFLKGLQVFANWQPEGVMGSDIDYIIHAAAPNGADHFFIAEFKLEFQPVPMGQKLLLNALRRRLPNSTVVTVHWHEASRGVYVGGDWASLGTVPIETFAAQVEAWWRDKKKGIVIA